MLKEIQVKNAKPGDKIYRLFDGKGLYLEISPNGGKYWRYKYRIAQRERRMCLGKYPEMTLAEARRAHSEAWKQVSEFKDPNDLKQEAKRQLLLKYNNNFRSIAEEWHALNKDKWSAKYSKMAIRRLNNDVFPKLGNRPIADIDAIEFLSLLRGVEERGALDLARRLLQLCNQILRYAIVTGRAVQNPLPNLKGALKPVVRKHQAYLKEDELPEYFEKLAVYDGHPQTRLALKFLLLTFVRTSELRGAEWTEIDFDKAEWRIPPERMKMRQMHVVPLSTQALAILDEVKTYSRQWKFVFPNQHKPRACMSENTMLFALYRMGYHSKATGHGFRSTASTILNENGFTPSIIERQLAHAERNEVRAAYNHAEYLPERKRMMQWWGDFLDEVKLSKTVKTNNAQN